MPTTAEVEARLRHAAQACEPIVDALVADVDVPADPPEVPRHRRGLIAVAAAVLAVVAVGAAVVAVTGDNAPDGEVRATTPDATETTAPPEPPGPALTVPLSLPDGTSGFLQVPGPERWRQTEWLVRGLSASGVEMTITALAGDDPEERVVRGQRPDGTPLVTWRGAEHLAVETDEWTALVPTAGLDGTELDAIGAQVREQIRTGNRPLGWQIGARSPSIGTGTAFELAEAGAAVRPVGARVAGDEGSLVAWVRGDGDACTAAPEPSTTRCLAEGRVVVDARGEVAEEALAGTTAVLDGGDPVVQHVPLAFADGTQAVVTLPSSAAFRAIDGSADVLIADERLDLQLVLNETTAERYAADDGATLTPIGDAGSGVDPVAQAWRADGDERSYLLVTSGGWTAALLIRNPGGEAVPADVVDRLAAELVFTATPDGVADLRGAGTSIIQSRRSIWTHEGERPAGLTVSTGPVVEQACASGAEMPEGWRCVADGRVVLVAERMEDDPGQPFAVDLEQVEVEITGTVDPPTDPPR